MLDPKNPIPRVAVASLLLGGAATACKSNGPSASSIASKACHTYQRCDPTDFSTYYTSISQCESKVSAEIRAGLTGETSACQKAALAYYDCFYSVLASSSTCSYSGAETACADEYARYYAACN